jgi:hypothetical protein
MKTVAWFFAGFIVINAILFVGTWLIDTYQFIATALIISGTIGLAIAWTRYAFKDNA